MNERAWVNREGWIAFMQGAVKEFSDAYKQMKPKPQTLNPKP
jgi:hypothetical protein